MNKNKKIIAIVLIIIAISLISVVLVRYAVQQNITKNVAQYKTAQASTTEDGRFEYTELSDGTVEISKYVGTDTVVEIPSTINAKSVTSIGSRAFYQCRSLTNITIPEGITSIGNSAFYYCERLTEIMIPKGVTSIGSSAFGWCINLRNPTIPDSVTSIGSSAFAVCSSLTNITIPDSVTSIGNSAFQSCLELTNITISSSVTSIGSDAFGQCYSLKNINVDSNNKNYCDINGVLYTKDMTKIIKYPEGKEETEYNIPNSVTSIGYGSFEYCSSLTNITIPEGVTSIGNRAFWGCSSLTNITIPEGVTSIKSTTFYGCSNLTNITIPEGVTNIEDGAFGGWSSLKNINVNSNNKNYCAINGVLYTKDMTKIIKYPEGKKEETEYNIPNSVTSIGYSAFEYCSSLTNITIPEGVTSIRKKAFYGCSSLTNITIPEGVTSIGESAFNGCGSLTNITIPKSVTSIGDKALANCNENLTIYCKSNTTAETYAKENNILYVTDDEQPSITITASEDGPTKAESITYTFTLSEEVTGFDEADIAVTNGEKGTFTETSSTVYTLEVTNSETCIQEVSIPEGAFTDLVGNNNTATSKSITVDRTAPTGTLKPSAEYTNQPTVTIYIDQASDIGGAGLSHAYIYGRYPTSDPNPIYYDELEATWDSANNRYYATFTFSELRNWTTGEKNQGEGRYFFDAWMYDVLGNRTRISGIYVTFDTTLPTCTITSSKESPANTNSITYTFTFSEEVTGFDIEDIEVTNGTKGTFNGSGKTYTLIVRNSGNCTQTVSIADGICTDLAGNSNKESSKSIIVERTDPICTITASEDELTNAGSITYTFTFSEEVTGFTKEDITVTNGTKGTFSGSGEAYTLVVTNSGSCTQTVSIPAGVCTSLVGNSNTEASKSITIDRTNPTAGTMTMKLGSNTGSDYTNNTWTSENVYISVNNGSDAESGHKSTTYKINGGEETTEPQTLTKSETYEIVVTTTDNVGNVSTNSYTIKIRRLQSIFVSTNPGKVTYKAYENFEPEGMVISKRYDIGDTEETSEYTIINGENLTCKVSKIEIQYNEDSSIKTELPITVDHAEVVDAGKAATCTEAGITEGKHCEVCNTILAKQEENPALGHDYEETVTAPTCLEEGYTTHTCTRCKDSYIDTYTDALGHKEVIDAGKAATCTGTGLTEGKHCSECKTVLVKQEEIPALGHDYKETVIAPTCLEKGCTTHECTRCEDGYIDTYIDALGHKEVVDARVEPTCTKTGLTEGKHCSECKTVLVKQEEIPALGHDYKETVIAPTCLEKGCTTHECTRCEDGYIDTYTEVLGHSFTNYISNNDATCTQDGTKTAQCDRCNETHTKADEGSKLPHNYENGKCTICGKEKLKVTSNTYKIEETYISKIQTKTTIKTIKENLQTNATEIKVYNKNGEEQQENSTVATGMTITFKSNDETITLKLVVAGDVNGDGKADFKDIVSMNKHRLNKKALDGENLMAGDITEDNKVDFKDIVKINKFRLNKIVQLFTSL